ncbi:hypothetical protein J7I80_11210 [Bacillus sp. ISL-41]|nr:hypothetical protein [Bacillus sp. ISL-41]MBT2642797.1 hypothetical protein [Bacillus sp. ISL-41]
MIGIVTDLDAEGEKLSRKRGNHVIMTGLGAEGEKLSRKEGNRDRFGC